MHECILWWKWFDYSVHVSDENLKILCIYCSLKIKIIHIMSISKILTDLCVITQIKIKSAFPDTFYIALMVKKSWKSIKKLFNNK